jgi:hypothetical protein
VRNILNRYQISALLVCIVFPNALLALTEEWEFFAISNRCFFQYDGSLKLSNKESIRYSVAFGVGKSDVEATEDRKNLDFKNQQYTLTIPVGLEEVINVVDEARGLISYKFHKVPMDILVQGVKLEKKYQTDSQWHYLIQGEFVEKLMSDNLKQNTFDFKIRVADQGEYQTVSVPNRGFEMRAFLLQSCEKYFE